VVNDIAIHAQRHHVQTHSQGLDSIILESYLCCWVLSMSSLCNPILFYPADCSKPTLTCRPEQEKRWE